MPHPTDLARGLSDNLRTPGDERNFVARREAHCQRHPKAFADADYDANFFPI